ncbi:DUF2182 domain-containing protein [Parasphingorhabdus pacifica]
MIGRLGARGVPEPRSWSKTELLLAGVLLGLAALAWLLTVGLTMPGMRSGVLTGAGGHDGMSGSLPTGLFLVTWVVMMAAMMLPGIIPFTVRISRMVSAGAATIVALTAGYLLVWGVTGVFAHGVLRLFDVLATGERTGVWVGAVVLILAGVYQFTPLKRWCLVRCRSPLALVVRYGPAVATSRTGALSAGIRHGGYCLGCCWALMLVLLAAGAMSLVWMALIAAVITLEKALPRSGLFDVGLGVVLLGLGGLVLVLPGLVA